MRLFCELTVRDAEMLSKNNFNNLEFATHNILFIQFASSQAKNWVL